MTCSSSISLLRVLENAIVELRGLASSWGLLPSVSAVLVHLVSVQDISPSPVWTWKPLFYQGFEGTSDR